MAGMDNLVKWALVGGAVYLTYNYLKKRNSLPKFMKPSAGRAGTSLDSETIAGMEEMGEEGYAMKIAQEQQLGASTEEISFSNGGGVTSPVGDTQSRCRKIRYRIESGLPISIWDARWYNKYCVSRVLKSANFSNAGANWVACPNPAYDCEGDCTANYGANAWDSNMGSTGSCNTGGAYWNPSPPTVRAKRSRFSGVDGWDSDNLSTGM